MRYVAIAIPTAIAVLLSLLTGGVCAQSWPSRSITMVVPFAAGGSADIVARGLADHLSEALGQSVVIDNKGGAGGNVGAATVAKAQPDGYMLLLATTGPAATNTLMYKNLTFDSQRDLAVRRDRGGVGGDDQIVGRHDDGSRVVQSRPVCRPEERP